MQPLKIGARVIVLEDEAIIALDIEATLVDAGFEVAAILSTCSSALEWLKGNAADVALLDLHLLDGSCHPVAKVLVDRDIPFVVFSGGSPTDPAIDPVFLKGAWLGKPAPSDKVVSAILDVLPKAAA